MRSRLIDGKLLTPSSPEAARHRLRQLDHEIKRLEARLLEPPRGSLSAHAEWRQQARGALWWLREERRQLAEYYDTFWRES